MMGILKRVSIWFLFVCLAFSMYGQNALSYELDTHRMEIGDENRLAIRWEGAQRIENISISYRSWDTLGGWEWLEERPVMHREEGDHHLYQKNLSFTVFDTGAWVLPALEISWIENEEVRKMKVEGQQLRVEYPEVASEDWAPIHPIRKEPMTWEDVRLYVYLALLVLALGFFWWWMRRNRSVETITDPEEELPDPHEEAFLALKELEDRRYLEEEQFEQFQIALTRIIRRFLQRSYDIPAMESTSREILAKLEGTSFPERKRAPLHDLLNMADLVKFARAEPAKEFHRRMLLEAYAMVRETNDQ